jgi:hypothetical protein
LVSRQQVAKRLSTEEVTTMDSKSFSIPLTQEERAALYDLATRQCRRPVDQLRWIVIKALGFTDDPPCSAPLGTVTAGDKAEQDGKTESGLPPAR